MLKVAVKHYLKSVGDKTFVPNPDYPEFLNADCLDFVIKRKPRWFWQRPVYTFDHFGLNDFLNMPLQADKQQFLKAAELLTHNYECSSKHGVTGKLGAKIASLVSLDVAADDVVSLSVKLQELMIQSIDYSAVQNMLRTKKVDLQSKYLKRLAQDKYNVVCLITRYIFINKPATITVNVIKDFHESCDVSKVQNTAIDDTGSYQSNKTKSITFDIGTRLAFEFCECLIGPDGSIELIDKSDSVRNLQMIPAHSTMALLPNYCAHITSTNQNFDIPDKADEDNLPSVFKSLSHLLKQHNVLDLKKDLLSLALENKKMLTKLELFLLHCQHQKTDCSCLLDKSLIFDKEMIENVHVLKFFKGIELPIKGDTISIDARSIHQELLVGIGCIIQCIYHLEVHQLKDLLTIMSKVNHSTIGELLFFLQSAKFLDCHNTGVYQRLSKDPLMKRLLSSIGVHAIQFELNEYFEPVFILLYG